MKPDIVFFGEDLPQRFYSLRLRDFSHCDLLIIMGTSLEVMGGFPLYMFFKRIFVLLLEHLTYRIARNFCGDFNLANWRIFY